MKSYLFKTFLIFIFINFSSASNQRYRAKGKLTCAGIPAVGAQIKLMDQGKRIEVTEKNFFRFRHQKFLQIN